MLFVITGPSGVGKGTILNILRGELEGFHFPVSATTRLPRPGDEDGVNYHFMSEEEFTNRRDKNEFIEWARYGDNLYGTLVRELEVPLSEGLNVVLEIELAGARQIRSRFPQAVAIFISPPKPEDLKERLAGRGTESSDSIAKRLQQAQVELAAKDEFDFCVINDHVQRAAEELRDILIECVNKD